MPTLEDAAQILRVLARSATGQEISVYTTFSTGPRRPSDPDGPQDYHVVLVDNGRSAMLGTANQDMLRCIRCGACMNHCPVYDAIGGHAYGAVYPGPMGAVLTPALIGIDKAGHLPNASTLCGRCESVCPVRIPLPKLMRHWREREFERRLPPAGVRGALAFWAFFATRPMLYRAASRGRGGSARPFSAARHGPLAQLAASPAPGPIIATCRRRRAARSKPAGAHEAAMNARACDLREHSPRARVSGREAPRRGCGRGAARASSARHHPGARRSSMLRHASPCSRRRRKPSAPASSCLATATAVPGGSRPLS